MTLGKAAVGIVTVASLVAAVHSFAIWQHGIAREQSRPLAERHDAAQRAASVEPFNQQFRVTAMVVNAEIALSSGRIDEAYFLLLPHSTTVRGDVLYTRTYQAAVEAKWQLDARKAHRQHAKEEEGGELAPEDVFE